MVRTNIVGFRGLSGKPTFLEWVLTQLKEKKDFKAFDDFITSSIDVGSFSESLLAPISGPKPLGILNLASSQVASKKEFIEAIAHEFHFSLEKMSTASVKDLSGAKRGESLGLDVSRAESLLGQSLPGLKKVAKNLFFEYTKTYEISK